MSALGDKIGSTIIAQTVGVPTVPWTGLGLKAPAEDSNPAVVDANVSQQLYSQCCITNASQATDSCNQVGYPILLKAAWGGGGRGIRKVRTVTPVVLAIPQTLPCLAASGSKGIGRAGRIGRKIQYIIKHSLIKLGLDKAACAAVIKSCVGFRAQVSFAQILIEQ